MKEVTARQKLKGTENTRKFGQELCFKCKTLVHLHILLHTLTVREVKVMHMPPKPLKVRAMKMRTESSANVTHAG